MEKESQTEAAPASKALVVLGWIVGLVPVALLVMSGVMKLNKSPELSEGFEHLGWPESLALALAIAELGSTLLYLIPQTCVLGAILLTGYLGGAIATHARIGEPFLIPAGLGVLLWLGLFLRDARLRALLPIRTQPRIR